MDSPFARRYLGVDQEVEAFQKMLETQKALLRALITFLVLGSCSCAGQAPDRGNIQRPHTFTIEGEHFSLDGKPFKILSGELHYARIPREYWRLRLRMAKAMGLNTVATYVFWNVHEPEPGVYDFKG